MLNKNIVIIITVALPIILFFGQPSSTQAEESCLVGNRCCTINATSCGNLGLVDYPSGNLSCQRLWGENNGQACCLGSPSGGVAGQCLGDANYSATPAITPPAGVSPSEPKFNSLIKTSPTVTIGNIIKGLLGLAGTLTIIMMVYGGLLLMTASGNEKTIGKAKQIIVWTAIGLVIIFSSYAILTFIFTNLKLSS